MLFNNLQEEWHQSLLSWQHPEAGFDAAVVALLNSEKAGKAMQQRRLHWQAAFQSLYYQLRSGKCRAFYLISSKVDKHTGWTACHCMRTMTL